MHAHTHTDFPVKSNFKKSGTCLVSVIAFHFLVLIVFIHQGTLNDIRESDDLKYFKWLYFNLTLRSSFVRYTHKLLLRISPTDKTLSYNLVAILLVKFL